MILRTLDNDAAVCLAVGLLTNLAGLIRCIVWTVALPFNGSLGDDIVWNVYIDHVNIVSSYFQQHQKVERHLIRL